MNGKQMALIKKDVGGITKNRRILTVMLVVPLILTVAVPLVFVLGLAFSPEETFQELQPLLSKLPPAFQAEAGFSGVIWLLANRIMCPFFLMIPLMAASVMAASSFAGERTLRTLETLLYAPLSLKEIFQAKILSALFVGMGAGLISFAAMTAVLEGASFLLTGRAIAIDGLWLITLGLLSPAISLCAIGITVRTSAKAQSVEEAQQRAVFLIFPVMALLVAQLTGVLMLNGWVLLTAGVVLSLGAAWTLKRAAGNFTYEALLSGPSQ